jgi:hypothetical protein
MMVSFYDPFAFDLLQKARAVDTPFQRPQPVLNNPAGTS